MSTTKQKSEKAIIASAACSAREREAGFSIFFFFLLAKETLRRSGNLEKNVKGVSGNWLRDSASECLFYYSRECTFWNAFQWVSELLFHLIM